MPYAVVGQCAAAAHIDAIDPSATRNSTRVELLIDGLDFASATTIVGNEPRVVFYFSDEKHPHADFQNPNFNQCALIGSIRVLNIYPLVAMLLGYHRLNDRVDVRDMIDVGLLDVSWPVRLGGELGSRLQALLDDPNG